MAKPFVLTAQINLQAPNATKTIANIRKQLSNVNAKVNISVPKGSEKQLKAINKNIQNIGNNAARAGQQMGKFTGGLRGALTYLVKYDLARTIINGVVDTIRDGTQAAISFEKEMIKVGQVTGRSLGSLQGLQNEIGRLSKNLGVSSSSLVKTSRILAQTGITAKDVKISLDALAKSTLAATFDDITSTTETAIAAMRQFGFSAKQLESELGRINALAANFAVEAGDIGVAIKRAGGAFKAAGGQLIELEALFTSVRSTTRETAETIATGFRTIFTRIQRPKTIQFLRQVGIELQDLAGNFIGPFEAVRKLNVALKDLDPRDVRYSQIVEQLGGFRQVSKVIPLIQQFATAQKALTVAQQGGSSLAKDAAKAQLGLGNQITKVKEEFQELFRTLVGSKGFQTMIKGALALAQALVKVTEAVTPLIPLIGAVALGKGAGFLATGMGRGRGRNQGGRIHKFASGGMVPGTGNRDTVPAMLTPGEFVIKKSSVKSIGSQRLGQMNKYAKGGKAKAITRLGSGFVKNNTNNVTASTAKSNKENFKEGKHVFTKGKKPHTDTVVTSVTHKPISLIPVLRKQGVIKRDNSIKSGFKGLLTKFAGKKGGTDKGNLFEDILTKSGYISQRSDGGAKFNSTNSPLDGKFASNNRLVEIKLTKLKSDTEIYDKRLRHENKKNKLKDYSLTGKGDPITLSGVSQVTNNTRDADLKRILDTGPKKTAVKKIAGRSRFSNQTSVPGGVGFAKGGGISGTDTVPAMLTPGEFVINRNSASRIGYGNLDRANRFGETPKGFAAGGRVPSSGKRYFAATPPDRTGGGGGGDRAFKLLIGLDLILPQLTEAFKATEGAVSKNQAAVTGVTNALLTLTTISLVFGETLKNAALQAGIGQKTQIGATILVAAVAAVAFAVQDFGQQLKKAALLKIEEQEGFKSRSETSKARDEFVRGSRLERQGSFASKGAIGGGAAGIFVGAAAGAALGTAIAPGVGTAIGALIGGLAGAGGGALAGAGIAEATFDVAGALREFDSKVRTLQLGASLEDLQKSLKLFSEGKASPRQIAATVTSGLGELSKGFATIDTDEELVDFQGAVSKAIPAISEYINQVAASSDSFAELENIVGTDTLNAFAQLSGTSLERIRKAIEDSVAVRKRSTIAQKAQLATIKATNKVLRDARNIISGFSSIEQSLKRFDAELDNVGQSISNNFGPASISKIAPNFADISNIFDFDKFNQQVDNVSTVMGSAGGGLANDIKQFALLSNILPNVLTEAAGEIGIGGARASEIIERKLIASDPGGIIGSEFRNAIVRRVTAVADMGEGGEGKFAGRIRSDIQGVVRDLTKGMKETQAAFQRAAEFIDSANTRLAKAYDIRTKLELDIAKKINSILSLQEENAARLRKARGQDPDNFAAGASFNTQQNVLLRGTNAAGDGSNVNIVGREFIRLKARIADSNKALSKFGIDATAGVSDLTESQRALLDENAKLKEEFARTKEVLNNYADVQKRIGSLQEKIAKEASKRSQLLSGASEFAFATDQRRNEIAQAMFAAQVATRKGIDAIPSDLRGAVKGVFEQFSDVRLFDGKTGKEAKAEIDIASLERFFGPLTDAQKKRITEATTQEERFINELQKVQDQAVLAQKALLSGLGADRKDLASTIGNLHRELVSGIKEIFLQQQERTIGREIVEARGTRTAAEGQLNALKAIRRLGIPVDDPRVLDAVRTNITTIKTLEDARARQSKLSRIEGRTDIVRGAGFSGVSESGEGRIQNIKTLNALTGRLQATFGVDVGNQVSQVLKDRLRNIFLEARKEGKGVSSVEIQNQLALAMGEFGVRATQEQTDIVSANEDILERAGLGRFVGTLTNNLDVVSAALSQLPEGATWAGLTSQVEIATSGIQSLNTQLNNIKLQAQANQAAGNAAAAQGGGGAGPVPRFAGGGFAPHGTDTVPAMLTPGEFVVNKAATKRNAGALHAINSGKTQYLARGGEVQDWFWSNPTNKPQGLTGDLRKLHIPSEDAAITASKKYIGRTFSGIRGVFGTGQYNQGEHGKEDLGGLFDYDQVNWAANIPIGQKAYKYLKRSIGVGAGDWKITSTAGLERWKPKGDIVSVIPKANILARGGNPNTGDSPFVDDIGEKARLYRRLVDERFDVVPRNSDGSGTKPGFANSSGFSDHRTLFREAHQNDAEAYGIALPQNSTPTGDADAIRIMDRLDKYGRKTLNPQYVAGNSGLGFIDDWDIKDTIGRKTYKGKKWSAEKAANWFEAGTGQQTITLESQRGSSGDLSNYVPVFGLDAASGNKGGTHSGGAYSALAKMSKAWKDQSVGVTSTYGSQAEDLLERARPFMDKFFKTGNAGNFQQDFVGGILSEFHPIKGTWGKYADTGGAFSRVGKPLQNLRNLSRRFIDSYNSGPPQGAFDDATIAEYKGFRHLMLDPTQFERDPLDVLGGKGEQDFYNLNKNKTQAYKQLLEFFNTVPQNPADPRQAAADLMDNYQELMGTNVQGVGSTTLQNIKKARDQNVQNNINRRKDLIQDVKNAVIDTPFSSDNKIVNFLKASSVGLKAANNFERVPSYAKRANADLRGVRDLADINWDVAAFDSVLPYLSKLADDLQLLRSSGLVNSIDGGGVAFNPDRVSETLNRSFDLNFAGRPDNASVFEVTDLRGLGNIVKSRFKGGVDGASLLDRMKMWSFGSISNWYGGAKKGEGSVTKTMFGGDIVDRHLNLLKDKAKEALTKSFGLWRDTKIQNLATGGPVFTPHGTDTVPAMLTPGEFVVNKSAAQSNMPLLKSINSGDTQYLQDGGTVKKKGIIKRVVEKIRENRANRQENRAARKAGEEPGTTIAPPPALSASDSTAPRQGTGTSITAPVPTATTASIEKEEIERVKSSSKPITDISAGSPTRKTEQQKLKQQQAIAEQREATARKELEAANKQAPKATTTSTSTGRQDTSIALTKTEQQELERARLEEEVSDTSAGSVPRTDMSSRSLMDSAPSATADKLSASDQAQLDFKQGLKTILNERAVQNVKTHDFAGEMFGTSSTSARATMDKGTQSTTTDWWYQREAKLGRKLTDQEKRDITLKERKAAGEGIGEILTGMMKQVEAPFIGAGQLGRAIGASVQAPFVDGQSEEAKMRWSAFGDELYNFATMGGVLHDSMDDFIALQKGTSDTSEHQDRKKHVFEPQTLDKYYATLKRNKGTWMGIGSYSDPLDEAGWWFDQMPELVAGVPALFKSGSNLAANAMKTTGSSFDDMAKTGFRLNPEQTGKLFNDVPAPTLKESLAALRKNANTSAALNASRVAQETSKYGGDVAPRPTRPTLKPSPDPALASRVKKVEKLTIDATKDYPQRVADMQAKLGRELNRSEYEKLLTPNELAELNYQGYLASLRAAKNQAVVEQSKNVVKTAETAPDFSNVTSEKPGGLPTKEMAAAAERNELSAARQLQNAPDVQVFRGNRDWKIGPWVTQDKSLAKTFQGDSPNLMQGTLTQAQVDAYGVESLMKEFGMYTPSKKYLKTPDKFPSGLYQKLELAENAHGLEQLKRIWQAANQLDARTAAGSIYLPKSLQSQMLGPNAAQEIADAAVRMKKPEVYRHSFIDKPPSTSGAGVSITDDGTVQLAIPDDLDNIIADDLIAQGQIDKPPKVKFQPSQKSPPTQAELTAQSGGVKVPGDYDAKDFTTVTSGRTGKSVGLDPTEKAQQLLDEHLSKAPPKKPRLDKSLYGKDKTEYNQKLAEWRKNNDNLTIEQYTNQRKKLETDLKNQQDLDKLAASQYGQPISSTGKPLSQAEILERYNKIIYAEAQAGKSKLPEGFPFKKLPDSVEAIKSDAFIKAQGQSQLGNAGRPIDMVGAGFPMQGFIDDILERSMAWFDNWLTNGQSKRAASRAASNQPGKIKPTEASKTKTNSRPAYTGKMQSINLFRGTDVPADVEGMLQEALQTSTSVPEMISKVKAIEAATGQRFAYRYGSNKQATKAIYGSSPNAYRDLLGSGTDPRQAPQGVMNSWWSRNPFFMSSHQASARELSILPITKADSTLMSIAWHRKRIADLLDIEVPGGAGSFEKGTQHFNIPAFAEGGMDTLFKVDGDAKDLVTNPLRISRRGKDIGNKIGGEYEQLFIRNVLKNYDLMGKKRLPNKVQDVVLNRASGGIVPGFAAGGQLPTRGTDTVPAMLTPGEFVIRKSAVDAVGVNALKNINSMGSGSRARSGSYFHNGGSVGTAGVGAGDSGDLLRGILLSNKNTTKAVDRLITAFKEREEARGQGAPTSHTLNSDNFTTAVGAFDKSVDRLESLLSGGITMVHQFENMAINMNVEGNVAATTDSPELASTIRSAVTDGINNWIETSGLNDLPRAT